MRSEIRFAESPTEIFMASFNKVLLLGNLTRDPELRYTPKGMAIAVFGLAVNRVWTSESGERKEEVTFIDVTAFGRTAETLAQYCKKGNPIFIEGRLRLEQWDDKQTGQKRQKLSVVIESFQFLNAAPKDGERQERRQESRPAQTTARERAAAQDDGPPPEDDDVPF